MIPTHRNLLFAAGLAILLTVSLPNLGAAQHQPGQPKVGLALSGGGARGAAHIGVLKILEREHIPIHCIAGTSFGAIVGGLYSLGYTATEIEEIFTRQDWESLFNETPERRLSAMQENRNFRYQGQLNFEGLSPELPSGLWSGQKMIEVLNSLTVVRMIPSGGDFDRLPIPFRAVATNLTNGEPYVFRSGRMSEALRASFAIPMLFTPVEKDGTLLVDGGLADNLPTDVVKDMGADIIIAVDVSAPLMEPKNIRTFLDVLDQSVSLLMKKSVDRNRGLANLVIQPGLENFIYSDYANLRKIIGLGEIAAEVKAAELRSLVAGVNPPAPLRQDGAHPPIIQSIAFDGSKTVEGSQVKGEIRSQIGKEASSKTMREDLRRLYATHLFSQVDCSLDRLDDGNYRLTYLLKEAPPHTLGASIRYDRDDKLVALVEGTVRHLFNSRSSATISTQFGGIEDYSATFRYIPKNVPFFFLEPKIQARRRERSDYRDGNLVDRFTDRRLGGQLAVGGTIFKRVEMELAYRDDRVTIGGGAEPNRLDGPARSAGITAKLSRDTFDNPDFPRIGSLFKLQWDKRAEQMGGDFSYDRYQLDIERYFATTAKSTIVLRASALRSTGNVPFFDRFYAGGYSFSDGGPRRFVGFDRDELSANQMAIFALGYRRELFRKPLSFTRRAYLTVLYNGAAMSSKQTSPYEFAFLNGAAAGIALDTLLGPVRLVGAWGEGGKAKIYLVFGPGF
jgi:NTE family protein